MFYLNKTPSFAAFFSFFLSSPNCEKLLPLLLVCLWLDHTNMTNYSDSNPNLQLAFSPPSFNLPTLLPSAGPSTSCTQKPRKKKKRSMVFMNEDGSASTSSPKPLSKPKQPKKPDPGAPEITRPCTECGKKFWSWKALFGHMRCHPEREWRGINPPPNHRKNVSSIKDQLYDSWVSVMSDEDHEVAASLLMLINGDCPQPLQENESTSHDPGTSCRFECGVCKKVFGSHQALGGHRASHRNVKGCFAITKSGDASEVEDQAGIVDQNRVGMILMPLGSHKCSICMREFSSGQALGGHMRCHWEKTEESSLTINQNGQKNSHINLNLPAPMEDSSSSSSESSGSSLDLRLGL